MQKVTSLVCMASAVVSMAETRGGDVIHVSVDSDGAMVHIYRDAKIVEDICESVFVEDGWMFGKCLGVKVVTNTEAQ